MKYGRTKSSAAPRLRFLNYRTLFAILRTDKHRTVTALAMARKIIDIHPQLRDPQNRAELFVRNALISAQIEGIDMTEDDLQQAYQKFAAYVRDNLSQRQKMSE